MVPRLNHEQLWSSSPKIIFHDVNSKLGSNAMKIVVSSSEETVRFGVNRLEFGKGFSTRYSMIKQKFVAKNCVNGVLELKINVSSLKLLKIFLLMRSFFFRSLSSQPLKRNVCLPETSENSSVTKTSLTLHFSLKVTKFIHTRQFWQVRSTAATY